MARDGSGTYTRVSNSFSNPVFSTTIDPTDADALFNDIETEMTDSLSRSGKGGMSADLDMNNNDINEVKTVVFQGSTSGNTTVAATAIAGTTTLTLPAATDTLVGKATTDTLTNKTLVAPALGDATATSLVVTNTQNGNSQINITNLSTGTSALATHTATNSVATGSVGVGGSGYTDQVILQNRAFLNAQITLAGIAINNAGANPIVYGISNVEVGRWSGSAPGTLQLGLSGTSVGKASFNNATSGSITIQAGTGALGTPVLTLPTATDTLIGKATTDTLTNKTYDTAGTGNSFSINGLAATANTGTGSVVRATSPVLVTPALGTPASGVLTNATGYTVANLADVAWTTYSPTATAQTPGGTPPTFTSVNGKYKIVGKAVLLQVDVVINAPGTASGLLLVTLPFTATSGIYVGSSFESVTAGRGGIAVILSSDLTRVGGKEAAGASYFAAGAASRVTFGLTYEIP